YWMGSTQLPASYKLFAEFIGVRGFVISCGPLLLALAFALKDPLVKACAAHMVWILVPVYLQLPDALSWNYYRYAVFAVPMLLYAMALVVRSGRAKPLLFFSLTYSLLLAIVLSMPVYLREFRYCEGARR